MARIRTIKPEFPHSESMGKVSRDARLAFVQMWTIADDSGRLRGNSRMLASLLFPYDDDAPKLIDGWMEELEREDCIVRYIGEGATYIQILNWQQHQRIDKPTPSKIPEFDESSRILANPPSRKGKEGKGVDGKGNGSKEPARKKVTLDELSVDHLAEWLAQKRAEGRYLNHDEHFVLEQFKQYCRSKDKKYADYIDAYRNAFEWEKCQPKEKVNAKYSNTGSTQTKPTWDAARTTLAERYAREAEREEEASLSGNAGQNLRITENLRKDPS